MYKRPYRNSPFGPENWADMYMARNFIRYMDSGKRPGCGFYVILGALILLCYIYFFRNPNNQMSGYKSKDGIGIVAIGRVKPHNGLNIRSEASSGSVVLGVVPYNEMVSIIDTNGHNEIISGQKAKWVKIGYNGTTGWVWGGFVQ